MTSPTALLQRAAELVVAFGLDDADTTAQDLRDASARGEFLLVLWTLSTGRDAIELSVVRRTDGLRASVKSVVGWLGVADAKRAHLLYGRVIDLAERIEALR